MVALALTVAACDSGRVEPSGSQATPASPRPSVTEPAPSGASPDASATEGPVSTAGPSPSPEPVGPASVEPFTPPPEMEPLDDDTCLALASRADVEATLGLLLGDITAQGTDPNLALTCTYAAASGGGQLLITTAVEDPGAYEAELSTATAYGQDPQALEGIGDQAFYGAATAAAPEQIVFSKGPVMVRLWNQTSATIGQSAFAALAAGVAEAIHGETPPAP